MHTYLTQITDPNKIYECMVFKKPFIASDFIIWKLKPGKLQAGLFVSPGSQDLIAESIISLHNSAIKMRHAMGCNGYAYESPNCWERKGSGLLQMYTDLLNS